MAAPAWRVEFHRAAVRDLRKLGADAESRVLRYLRERIASSEDPRRFGHALSGDRRLLQVVFPVSPTSCRHKVWLFTARGLQPGLLRELSGWALARLVRTFARRIVLEDIPIYADVQRD